MEQKIPVDYPIWKNKTVAQNFLKGVRGAIPLAAEQIDCLLRIIHLTQTEVKGFLGKAIAQQDPRAQGVFIDILVISHYLLLISPFLSK